MGVNEPALCDNLGSDGNSSTVCDPVSEPTTSADTFSNVGGTHRDVFDNPSRTSAHTLGGGRPYRQANR